MFFFLPSNFKLKFLIFFILIALAQKGLASVTYSDTATLSVKGKTTILNCKVQLLKVLSDSRCPLNTRCIVAGIVSCQVRVNGVKQELSSAVPARINGDNGAQYTIEIKDANPLPTAGIDNNYPKYKVTFEVHQM
jgi:hypothetical protein